MRLRVQKLMLWMNSGCNARCGTCDIWREQTGQMLSLAQIQGWTAEWAQQGLKTVVLCGEALIHPEIWPIAAAIRSAGIRVELLSNGLLLARHAREVVSHCDVLRVSLDGPAALHSESRGIAGAYTKLAEGMAKLRALAPAYDVGGRCAIHQRNFRQLAETVAAAKALGLSSISFSATDLYNEEAFRRFGRITDDYVAGYLIGADKLDELARELERFVDACRVDFASGFITDTPEFLREQVWGYYAALASVDRERPVRCNAPWTSAVLDYDGTVRPCFPMPGYGKIENFGGLEIAINSSAAEHLRAGLDVSDNTTCRRCVDQTFALQEERA
jgi:MoaA/NifB/PqqE/SkfB family radical SAM enzyme